MATSHPPEGALFLKRLAPGRLPIHGRQTAWPLGTPTRASSAKRLQICRTGFHLAPFNGRGINTWYRTPSVTTEMYVAEVSPDARTYVSATTKDKFVCSQATLVGKFDLAFTSLYIDQLVLGANWFAKEYAKAPRSPMEPLR